VSETVANTQTLALRDGRRLGYAQWGAGDGDPVLYLHGGLGSRLERHRDEGTYRALGVRLITVDRPGHGLSSPHAGRTLRDFAEDLKELLDHLKLDTVTALGFSNGGMNALGFACHHPARVRAVGVVSGIGTFEGPGAMEDLAPRMQRTYLNARKRPLLARTEMRVNVAAFRYRPSFAFKQLGNRKVTSDPEFQRGFREALLEGARQGVRGFVSDIALNTAPWGFDPSEVRVPVRWWHGQKDMTSPVSHAQHVCDRLQDVELTITDDGGHFVIHTIIEDVLSALAPHI